MRNPIIALILLCCMLLTSCSSNGAVSAFNYDNFERLKEAVEDGADVNEVSNGLSATPLLYALRNKQKIIAEYLLSQGADPNYIDRDGISILMYTVGVAPESGIQYTQTAEGGNYKVLLNDERTDVNLTGILGYTALDYACLKKGKQSTIEDLIAHGANITATTMRCAMEGYAAGSCPESVLKTVYDSVRQQGIPSGLDPEVEAALSGDADTLRTLADSGKIKPENQKTIIFLTAAFGDTEAFKQLTDENLDLDEIFHKKTLLCVASVFGNLETVKFLVDKQADVEIASRNETAEFNLSSENETALTKALKYGHIDIADYLFQNGAELQVKNTIRNHLADALETACESGNLDAVKWVIAHGYPITTENTVNALSAAAKENHIDVLAYLIEDVKMDVNAEHIDWSALGSATRNSCDLDTVKFLVEHGADVDGVKSKLFTPLEGAMWNNRVDVVQYLIDKGANVNLEGIKPRPLTFAVQKGYFEIVKLLVENGADIRYKEGWTDGKDTALDVAKSRGSKRITDYLKNALGST